MIKKFEDYTEQQDEPIYDPIQLEEGIKIEKEHGDVYEFLTQWANNNSLELPLTEDEFAEMIAKAHLREMFDYYTKLKEMEDAG